MDFTSKTVLGIFDASQKTFVIPVYQRAYSWEEDNWKAFYNDLKEQISSKNKYFMGNLLLEVIKKDQVYEIIDGQQRLTTIVLFIHSILTVMETKRVRPSGANIKSKRKIFLENEGVVKLQPVEYDRPFFNTLVSGGAQQLKAASPSQKLMQDAIIYFAKKLKGESAADLIALLSKLEETEITTVELSGKRESALMFELQNNRGKDLTNLEKLKSYFMYQAYVLSAPPELDKNINDLSILFEQIYMAIKDLEDSTSEDNVLMYHCQAYINGFSYRSIDEVKDKYRAHKTMKWINEFVRELHTSFQSMKKLEKLKTPYWRLLNQMKDGVPAFIYPFIIKAYKYFESDESAFERFFHLMENLTFRYYLINSRADFRSRLHELLNSLNGTIGIDDFIAKIKDKMTAEYWSDSRLKEQLESQLYGNRIVNYLLWRYENSLQLQGYFLTSIKSKEEAIEHISPQTPTDGQPLASGYELTSDGSYPDEYDNYLHSIGNLLLISTVHNSKIGNLPFSIKRESFESNNVLRQQAEIARFASGKGKSKIWDHTAIEKRTAEIAGFAMRNWSFDEI